MENCKKINILNWTERQKEENNLLYYTYKHYYNFIIQINRMKDSCISLSFNSIKLLFSHINKIFPPKEKTYKRVTAMNDFHIVVKNFTIHLLCS